MLSFFALVGKYIHEPLPQIIALLPNSPVAEQKEPNQLEDNCMDSCSSSITNHTAPPMVLVIGASTFIGSAIALKLYREKLNVIPIETEEIDYLNSLQFRNWERLSSEGMDPMIVHSSNIASAIEELKYIEQIIFVPRALFDCVLENNIFKEEGIRNLEYFVNMLQTVKGIDHPIRVTLITKKKPKLAVMQSAWLKTLENSIEVFSSLYRIKIGLVRVDGVTDETNLVQYDTQLLNIVHCIAVYVDSKCFDVTVAIESNGNATPSPAERNLQQKNAVMSTYFTTVKNPQNLAVTIARNKFNFMQDWLISANKLGIQAIIFHDSLEDNFIQRIHNKYENVVFQKVTEFKGQRSPNDYRFYLQYDYLKKHPEISNVLLSDIRDTTLYRDPFEVMQVLGSSMVYVGLDVSYYTNSWSHLYPKGLINACYRRDSNTISVTSDPFYNAGAIGGTRQVMVNYLRQITDSLNTAPHSRNCNMATVTIVTHKLFRDRAFSGYPFQAAFKMDIPGPQGLAVKHKIENRKF